MWTWGKVQVGSRVPAPSTRAEIRERLDTKEWREREIFPLLKSSNLAI